MQDDGESETLQKSVDELTYHPTCEETRDTREGEGGMHAPADPTVGTVVTVDGIITSSAARDVILRFADERQG